MSVREPFDRILPGGSGMARERAPDGPVAAAGRRRMLLASAAAGMAGVARGAPALPTVRYGGDAAFPPFESLDAQGRPRGFLIDLLQELGPLMQVRFAIALQPWAETEEAFRRGQIDVMAMVITAERRKRVRFTPGFATPAFAVYRRPDHPEPQGLQDLAGLRIAVRDSDGMRDARTTWLAGVPATFIEAVDATQALAAVLQGRADVALLPRAYAEPALAAGAAPGIVASRLSLGVQTYAFAVAQDNEALARRLQLGLDTLEGSGRLEALRMQWLASHRDAAERGMLERGLERQRDWTWGVAAASAAVLLTLGVGLRRRGHRVEAEKRRRRDAEAELKRAEEMLERAFTRTTEPMLVVDRGNRTVRDANAALMSLLDVNPPALIGQPLEALGRHIDDGALQQLVQSLDSDGELVAVPLRLHRADGRERDCLVSADILHLDGGDQVFCVVRDITDRLDADAGLRAGYDALAGQLAQSRREVEAAREGRSRAETLLHDFTRSVAHDLRTPVHAVQGFAGLLRDRLQAGHVQDAMRYGEHIERAAQRMNAMIDALAGLAQLSSKPLLRQPIEMTRLARQTWSMLTTSQPGRAVSFELAELPAAQGDPDLVAQVWQNLLDNARKYSARVESPNITIDSSRDARGTWYRITDNGAGFDMANARHLFQPFQRMHSARQFEGSGIGLSLVRRIVDLHGGDVRLRSAPGVGTVAEFTLDPPSVPG